jgi:hypothetical protein
VGGTSTRHDVSRGNANGKTALNEFDIMFPGRLDLA